MPAARRRSGLLRFGLAADVLELPAAFFPLAEGIIAALKTIVGVGLDRRLATLQLAFGVALLRRDLAGEAGFRRLPFDGRAIGCFVQRFHDHCVEQFYLFTGQPRDRRVLETAHVECECRRREHQRQDGKPDSRHTVSQSFGNRIIPRHTRYVTRHSLPTWAYRSW